MTYIVTVHGITGSTYTADGACEGEMLDRVRLAMNSVWTESVTVTREQA